MGLARVDTVAAKISPSLLSLVSCYSISRCLRVEDRNNCSIPAALTALESWTARVPKLHPGHFKMFHSDLSWVNR